MAGAKQIRDEIMRMTIVVNSDPAQREIHNLNKANDSYSKSIEELKQKKKELGRVTDSNRDEFKKLNAEIQKNQSSIDSNRKKIQDLTGALDINQMTMAQLRKEAQLLRAQLAHVIPGTQPARDLQAQLDLVNGRMSQVRTGADATSSSFSSLSARFNHYSGLIAAGSVMLAGFGISVQKIIDVNNKMADAMSGVEKNVNMSRQEVELLTQALAGLDTRTKKIDLLKIAEEGGKLGVPKDQILDFVTETDKAVVALGDSWEGGAGKIANSLGKISTLYDQTRNIPVAEAINDIGSGLNELAASGAASEKNIADFTTRVGAMPSVLKPTLADAMGLGAAFEQSGIDAERSATAYSTFTSVAANNANRFAEVMQLPVEKVKELINTNPTEFFLQFSEGMKGMDPVDMATTLDYLKLNDQYVKSIVGAAGDNVDMFRDSMLLSNQAVAEGTSLQTEFNKVNNNAAGIYDKILNKIANIGTDKSIFNFINNSIQAFGKFMGVVEDTDGTITDFRATLMVMAKVVGIAVAATFSYNAALALTTSTLAGTKATLLGYTIVQRLNNGLNQVGIILQTAYNFVIGGAGLLIARLTGITALQTAAQIRWNAAMAANPATAVITVIGALIAAYYLFSESADEAVDKQKMLNEVSKEAETQIISEKAEIEKLMRVAQDKTASDEQRLAAIKRLNEISPYYLGQLNLENINTQAATAAVNAYTDALRRNSKQKALSARYDKIQAEIEEINDLPVADQDKDWLSRMTGGALKLTSSHARNLHKNQMEQFRIWAKEGGEEYARGMMDSFGSYYEKRNNKIASKQEMASAVMNEIVDLEKSKVMPETDVKPAFAPKTGGKTETGSKTNSKQGTELKQYQSFINSWIEKTRDFHAIQEMLDLERRTTEIQLMEDKDAQRMAMLKLEEERELYEIDRKKKSAADFQTLESDRAKAKDTDKPYFDTLKARWNQYNDNLEQEKAAKIKLYGLKRQELQHIIETEHIQNQDEAFKARINQLEREYSEEVVKYTTLDEMKAALRGRISDTELENIKTYEEAKRALQGTYQKKEIELSIAHLEKIRDLYAGIDLSLLTEEQRKQVMVFLDEANTKIANAKAGLSGENPKTKEEIGKDALKALGEKPVDIFGYSEDQWRGFFSNLNTTEANIGRIQMAFAALSQVASVYFQFLEANEKRQLQVFQQVSDSKKKRLQSQLDIGMINQEDFKKQTIKIDEELAQKKQELADKRAKREKAMKIVEVIMNTSVAIMQAYAQMGPIAGTIAAVLIGTLGAVQLATIRNTPLPSAEGYESGFNTDQEYPITRSQDGRTFRAKRRKLQSGPVDRPTHFIAGEGNKLEMVIDHPTWTSYPPELKQAIHSANARANGYETGYNVRPDAQPVSSGSDAVTIELIQVLHEYKDVMQDIRTYGITAVIDKSPRTGKAIREIVKDSENLENKNKH